MILFNFQCRGPFKKIPVGSSVCWIRRSKGYICNIYIHVLTIMHIYSHTCDVTITEPAILLLPLLRMFLLLLMILILELILLNSPTGHLRATYSHIRCSHSPLGARHSYYQHSHFSSTLQGNMVGITVC